MVSTRIRTVTTGAAIAVTAALIADQGDVLGADLPRTALLGTALGAVVALVPDRGLTARAGGFVGGILAAWLGYGLRAGLLPDIPAGRAIAAAFVVGVVTAVAVIANGRVPLWAGLIGVGTMVGAYETTYASSPASFLLDSTTAATTALVGAALGLLVAAGAELLSQTAVGTEADAVALEQAPRPRRLRVPGPRAAADADVEQEVSR